MNGAQHILDAFHRHSISTVFGYPGGCIMPLYDALVDDVGVEHVLCRHEQACALAADGYARASGKLGVCIATSGPGATNLITGVANAHRDSIPMLVITPLLRRQRFGPSPITRKHQHDDTTRIGLQFGNRVGVICQWHHGRCRIGDPGRKPFRVQLPREVIIVIAVASIGRGHLRLNPGLGARQCGKLDQPKTLPGALGAQQTKSFQPPQLVLLRHRQHQINVALGKPILFLNAQPPPTG